MSEMSEIRVSLEDRLRVENLQLNMEKLQAELQVFAIQVQNKVAQRNNMVQQMESFRKEFQEKYGIDLATVKINEDGTVSPAAPPPVPPTAAPEVTSQ